MTSATTSNARGLLGTLTSAFRMVRWVALLMVVLFLCSGVTTIQPGEIGLVLRCGRLHGINPQEQIKQPGLLLTLPYPIDRVIRVPVKQEGEVHVDRLWQPLGGAVSEGQSIDPVVEGYCLAGDQNILQARLVVKYRIADPIRFVLHVTDPEAIVADVAMAALTQTVSSWRADDALRLQAQAGAEAAMATNRSLSRTVHHETQRRLDALEAGMRITALEFKEIQPPRHVVREFRRAQSARIEKETMKREAEGFASRELPKARAERDRLVQAARADASRLQARAVEETSVFSELLAEYRRNPALVRERYYREAVEHILANVGSRYFVPPTVGPGDVRLLLAEERR